MSRSPTRTIDKLRKLFPGTWTYYQDDWTWHWKGPDGMKFGFRASCVDPDADRWESVGRLYTESGERYFDLDWELVKRKLQEKKSDE